jgi:hypothetical protein
MTKQSPRDRLAGRELLGFVRRGGDQVAERASSAKVTTTKSLADLDKELDTGSRKRRTGRSS